jgi:hypothetical protein
MELRSSQTAAREGKRRVVSAKIFLLVLLANMAAPLIGIGAYVLIVGL